MKEYLPLGSVVTLKKSSKKMIIIGRCQICNDVQYDYSACLFPEGYIGKDRLYVFNSDDVDTLYYVGMQNDEEFAFRKVLQEADEKLKNE